MPTIASEAEIVESKAAATAYLKQIESIAFAHHAELGEREGRAATMAFALTILVNAAQDHWDDGRPPIGGVGLAIGTMIGQLPPEGIALLEDGIADGHAQVEAIFTPASDVRN